MCDAFYDTLAPLIDDSAGSGNEDSIPNEATSADGTEMTASASTANTSETNGSSNGNEETASDTSEAREGE